MTSRATAGRRITPLGVLFVCTLEANQTLAHAMGERYDLPVPLAYYLVAAAAIVVVTFVIAILAMRAAPPTAVSNEPRTVPARPDTASFGRHAIGAARLLAAAVVVLVILVGWLGNQHPTRNLAPSIVWIVWWVGLPLTAALIGDLWAAINPWRTIHRWTAGSSQAMRPYPAVLGTWPACIVLLTFAWIEVVWPGDASPALLASGVLAYGVLTWLAMRRVGPDVWLRHGEAFTVMCAVLGRLAPISGEPGATFRWPGVRLLQDGPATPSMAAFIILMLATVLFDGLLGTRTWRAIEHGLHGLGLSWPTATGVPGRTIGLLGAWLVLSLVYLAACWAMTRIGDATATTAFIASRYAFALVPIAAGYLIAHNLAFFINEVGALPDLIADPFGWRDARPAAEPAVGAAFAWYVAVGAIVLGHVGAVIIAHGVALRHEGERSQAVRRLVPMTIVMVAYTVVSLFVLAEPLVRFRSPDPTYSTLTANPTVPG